MRYKVYFTYSPQYDSEAGKAGETVWWWDRKPWTLEDYEEVVGHIRNVFNAKHVLLYAVVPELVWNETNTAPTYLKSKHNKKKRLYEPWRIDA
jgi:hypothetical protein